MRRNAVIVNNWVRFVFYSSAPKALSFIQLRASWGEFQDVPFGNTWGQIGEMGLVPVGAERIIQQLSGNKGEIRIVGTVLIWSAVTCHRFGPWRLAAAFRQKGLCGTLAATCPSDQSDDSRGPPARQPRWGGGVVALQIKTLPDIAPFRV